MMMRLFKEKGLAALLAVSVLIPFANANEQCNWWGRDIYPICEHESEGWGRENGEKCISRHACINDQPSDKGGIIDGGSNSGGGNGGGNSGKNDDPNTSVDQCNTTSQCQAIYGSSANDCLNSQAPDSVCMCGSQRCDGENGSDGDGGNDGDVPQPPSSCSNVGNSIPNGIKIHTILDKHVSRSDFPEYTHWYTENGNVQRFQLHEGDQNTTSSILRPRVEAFAGSAMWQQSGWHEFSANYYLSDWDEPQLYAVFQIKTNDASNFIIQGLIQKDGSLRIARRSKGQVVIANDVFNKPFNLRVRSNGHKFEVYLNCELVLAENHPQPSLESNNTRYHWRWGLYRQKTDDDRQDGTTTLFVTGPKYN